jgi:hypothetical protein
MESGVSFGEFRFDTLLLATGSFIYEIIAAKNMPKPNNFLNGIISDS